MLGSPEVPFTRAESVTLLPTCTYDVFYHLDNLHCKRLFIETMEKETLGVALDAPMLKFSKIRINLTKCDMIGGFEGLFRIIANENLELLELRMAETEVQIKELLFLLDRLLTESPNLHTLLLGLERKIVTEEEHIQLNERISRLPLKRLTMLFNESYVQYDTSARWPLPKTCEALHLDLSSNLLRNVVGNLSLALASSENLK